MAEAGEAGLYRGKADEKLEEKAAAVLEVIDSIRKHERSAHKIRLKLKHCRKKSRRLTPFPIMAPG